MHPLPRGGGLQILSPQGPLAWLIQQDTMDLDTPGRAPKGCLHSRALHRFVPPLLCWCLQQPRPGLGRASFPHAAGVWRTTRAFGWGGDGHHLKSVLGFFL